VTPTIETRRLDAQFALASALVEVFDIPCERHDELLDACAELVHGPREGVKQMIDFLQALTAPQPGEMH
jgi:hypothetical protein